MCECKSHNSGKPENGTPEVILEFPEFMKEATGRETVCVDSCIVEDIKKLWDNGIITRGCCCGHNVPHMRGAIVDQGQAELAASVSDPSINILYWSETTLDKYEKEMV